MAEIKNISFCGCYVKTARKMPQNGEVEVVLHMCDVHTEIWGVVGRCDATGLGIQFSHGATGEDWDRLQSLIRRLQSLAPTENTSPVQRLEMSA